MVGTFHTGCNHRWTWATCLKMRLSLKANLNFHKILLLPTVITLIQTCSYCINSLFVEDIEITYGFLTALDVVIIIMCLLSITLTVGTLRRATKLEKQVF